MTNSIFNKMEDDLNILQNGRQPQFSTKWKRTSIFYKMEDDLISFKIGIRPFFFIKMEDELNFLTKWKTT